MITMQQWMELVGYRITEGSDYCWDCYGPNSYSLDSWDGDQDGSSFCIIFDTKDQTVYEVQIHDYANQRAYRMVNPDFAKKMKKESKRRGVNKKEAWDDVDYVDLEVEEDFMEKATAVFSGEHYNTGVLVPLKLPDDLLMFAFKAAHAENMTFNDWMNQMLKEFVDKVAAGEYTRKDAQAWLNDTEEK
jgi:hypothetical protein